MKTFYSSLISLLVSSKPGQRWRWVFWAWSLGLFLIGAFWWGKFLNWGQGPYSYHDWAEITIPRLAYLQDAVQQGVLPLHISDSSATGGITDRFQANPDVIISPKLFLLGFLDVNKFILVNFLMMYTVGFAGLVWFSRKRRLSIFTFTVLFLLFNFNGDFLAHISIGHYSFASNFLFPWLIALVFDLVDGPGGWDWVLKFSAVMFVLMLEGGYHQFVWMLILLAILAAALPRHLATIVPALVFSVIACAVRLLPMFLLLGGYDNQFIAGYPFLNTIWESMTGISLPGEVITNNGLTGNIGTWEYASYVGLAGAIFLVWFGLVRVLRSRSLPGSFSPILLPVIGIIFLSLDRVYSFLLAVFPLPLFTGERVSARMFNLAFVCLIFLAVIELQRWWDEQEQLSPAFTLGSLMVIGMLAHDMWQFSSLWRVDAAAAAFEQEAFRTGYWVVTNHADPLYTGLLGGGLVITLAVFGLLAYLTIRQKRVQAKTAVPTQ